MLLFSHGWAAHDLANRQQPSLFRETPLKHRCWPVMAGDFKGRLSGPWLAWLMGTWPWYPPQGLGVNVNFPINFWHYICWSGYVPAENKGLQCTARLYRCHTSIVAVGCIPLSDDYIIWLRVDILYPWLFSSPYIVCISSILVGCYRLLSIISLYWRIINH